MQWLSSTVIMETFPQLDAEYLRVQPFGRYVEKLVIAEDAVLQRGDNLLPCHSEYTATALISPVAQILYLVFHQGDKRRDDDAQSCFRKGRYLECDGLTASGRHQPNVSLPSPILSMISSCRWRKVRIPNIALIFPGIYSIGFISSICELDFAPLVGVFLRWCNRCQRACSS